MSYCHLDIPFLPTVLEWWFAPWAALPVDKSTTAARRMPRKSIQEPLQKLWSSVATIAFRKFFGICLYRNFELLAPISCILHQSCRKRPWDEMMQLISIRRLELVSTRNGTNSLSPYRKRMTMGSWLILEWWKWIYWATAWILTWRGGTRILGVHFGQFYVQSQSITPSVDSQCHNFTYLIFK